MPRKEWDDLIHHYCEFRYAVEEKRVKWISKRQFSRFHRERSLFSLLTESKNKLEVIGKEGNDFIVKVPDGETYVKIEDIYAEMFPIVETSPLNSTPPIFLK